MSKPKIVGRIYGMKYSWKGHKDSKQTQEQNKIKKKSGQAQLVYVKDINRNIPTTLRWARGDKSQVSEMGRLDLEVWVDSSSISG